MYKNVRVENFNLKGQLETWFEPMFVDVLETLATKTGYSTYECEHQFGKTIYTIMY